jgi:hypothetical protein
MFGIGYIYLSFRPKHRSCSGTIDSAGIPAKKRFPRREWIQRMHGATFTILKILYVVIYKRWNGTLFLFYSPWWWDVRCDWRVWIFMISSQTTRALVVSSQRFYNDLKLIWKKKNRHHPNIYRWPDSNRMKTVKNITMLERKAPHPPRYGLERTKRPKTITSLIIY